MLLNVIELIIVFLGLAVTFVLFYRIPRIDPLKSSDCLTNLSVIIPARNEEANLPRLLEDLLDQSCQPAEIICVDDDSSDSTADIARSFGVRVVSLKNKPEGWTGKSWACHNGAEIANGDTLLFLDADVRLGKNGIKRLLQTYQEQQSPISVQPFHITEKWYEQCSILFNLIQIAANGMALPKPLNVGLYGPIVLLSQSDYAGIGGHESVKQCIVEDMALGERLKEKGVPYRLYVGDHEIAFRMYPGGIRSLLQGWTKNLIPGVTMTPIRLFLGVFLWVASMISVPIHVITFGLAENWPWFILYSILYLVWVVILFSLSKKLGQFFRLPIVFYPVLIVVYFAVLFVSVFKKLFGLSVVWKGRAIREED